MTDFETSGPVGVRVRAGWGTSSAHWYTVTGCSWKYTANDECTSTPIPVISKPLRHTYSQPDIKSVIDILSHLAMKEERGWKILPNSLQKIGQQFGTDKSVHTFNGMTYCHIYERYFDRIRNEVTKFIEIGIKNGSSLRMWKEYFPNATIFGIDIDPRCKQFEEDRIKCFIGDQNNEHFLHEMKEKIGEYDILLDDGSHITEHQIKSFDILYENCKNNGFYIIEDLRNSYEEFLNHHDVREIWPGMKYNDANDELKNYRDRFIQFTEEKVKQLDFHKSGKMFAIHHYPMIIIFENLKNTSVL